MVITEEELRQAWQNGRGEIPAYPPGTRFTPSALDFLKTVRPASTPACAPSSLAAPASGAGGSRDLEAPPGQRMIYTAAEVPDLLAAGGTTLVVHPSVTVTHAALELLRKAGVRVVPFVEPSRQAPPVPASSAAKERTLDEDLLRRVKDAVRARLGRPVDPALLDAVVRRVLAALEVGNPQA